MLANLETPTTSVLLIDANATDRIRFAAYLKNCSPDYTVFEAIDGQSGLDLHRSRQIDCVVLSLDLPDQSGFRVLVDLVPIASIDHTCLWLRSPTAPRVEYMKLLCKMARMRVSSDSSRQAKIWREPFCVLWHLWDGCQRKIGSGLASEAFYRFVE